MTAKLPDFLSDQCLENLIIKNVTEGEIFRMRLSEDEGVKDKNRGDNGRNKYFVILGHDSEGNAIGFVLIDSQINPYLPKKRKDLHYPIKASKYSFLDGKNRFIDCSDFKIISKAKFSKLFGAEKSKGKLDEDDLAFVKEATAHYEDASPKQLKRFGLI